MTDIKKLRTYKMRVSEIITETPDTKSFRFKYGNLEPLDFIPGQFVSIKTNVNVNGEIKPINRPFSIANSPTEKSYLEITVKKLPGGILSTHMIDNTKIGDEFEVRGPYGLFTYKEGMADKLVLIGGGSGVVPLMCITRYVAAKNLNTQILFLDSNKTPNDIIYHKEQEMIQKNHKNIKFIYTITRPEGTGWTGITGRIDKAFLEKYDLYKDALYYICGPPPMVEAIVADLKDSGIEQSRIKIERYH